MAPDYKRIYSDLLNKKYPDKRKELTSFFNKENLSVLDIIELDRRIFGTANKQTEDFNQKHRSYSKSDIIKILKYQKRNNLNNSQLANHFKLSRNTVARWKKLFVVQQSLK